MAPNSQYKGAGGIIPSGTFIYLFPPAPLFTTIRTLAVQGKKLKYHPIILITLLITLLQGCAVPTKEFVYSINRDKGIYPPVRLHVNRVDSIPRFYISRLNEVASEFKSSKLFLDINAIIDTPYVLDVNLDRGTTDDALDTAGQLLSAATLFIVPSKVHNFNTLTVDFYKNGKIIKSYKYEEHYEETLSVTDMSTDEYDVKSNEFISIRNLVNRFLRDFDKDSLMPRIYEQKHHNDNAIKKKSI